MPAASAAGASGRAPIKGILKKGGGKQSAGGAGSGARQASPARDDDEHGWGPRPGRRGGGAGLSALCCEAGRSGALRGALRGARGVEGNEGIEG